MVLVWSYFFDGLPINELKNIDFITIIKIKIYVFFSEGVTFYAGRSMVNHFLSKYELSLICLSRQAVEIDSLTHNKV